MLTLKGKTVYLRALEPEDLELIHTVENDESVWHLSNTKTPYSWYLIKQYLEEAHKDIYETKQLRLVISNYDKEILGLIDIFDFDPSNHRAGIGILIYKKDDRHKGYGSEALRLLTNYCFTHLNLNQLYCNIAESNEASLTLFKNQGFKLIGLKEDWTYNQGVYTNEYLLQLKNTTKNVH